MKTLIQYSLIFTLLLSAQLVFSHGDHEHPKQAMTEMDAQIAGLKAAKVFSEVDSGLGFGKLPESWSVLTGSDTKIHMSGKGYFIVAVSNEAEAKTLYVLMSSTGDLFDANFNGNFPKLNP
ncbi:MAG: DUF6488 family protein [Cellvibrionaceae bacterium]